MRRSLLLMALGMMVWSAAASAKEYVRFTGGPSGGTFQYFSNGISVWLSENLDGVRVSNQGSAGSTENLRRINRGKAGFGVVHSGDLFLGRQGKLTGDKKRYDKVFALGVLYRSAAQLVARADGPLRDPGSPPGSRNGPSARIPGGWSVAGSGRADRTQGGYRRAGIGRGGFGRAFLQ